MLIKYTGWINGAENSIVLEYQLREYPIVQKWVSKVIQAKELYEIDDPDRFYGFGSIDDQIESALNEINSYITVINLHSPSLISRQLYDINDQDTLNYLHHIFEIFHGLLDQQTNSFWQGSPESVRRCLAGLNIAVHRCESIARGAQKRHVVTWFGLPKTDKLESSDYQYFTQVWKSGTVFLNYVEIGKTIDDLAEDNDKYIHKDAFRPFKHYSADFVVRFFDQTELQAKEKTAKIMQYYRDHSGTFGSWRPEYTPGSLPVADLITPVDFTELEKRQCVADVYFV